MARSCSPGTGLVPVDGARKGHARNTSGPAADDVGRLRHRGPCRRPQPDIHHPNNHPRAALTRVIKDHRALLHGEQMRPQQRVRRNFCRGQKAQRCLFHPASGHVGLPDGFRRPRCLDATVPVRGPTLPDGALSRRAEIPVTIQRETARADVIDIEAEPTVFCDSLSADSVREQSCTGGFSTGASLSTRWIDRGRPGHPRMIATAS
jgi:hypothetical protein